MQPANIQGTVLIKVFFIDGKLTTEPIQHSMNALVSPGRPTVLVASLEFSVVVSGQETRFVEEWEDLVLDGEDVGLFLVLHAIVGGAVVAKEEGEPVSGHFYGVGSRFD